MSLELERRPGAPKPELEYNPGRRDFLISLTLTASGVILGAVGFTIDDRKHAEDIRELEERLISNYLNNRDPKISMQKAAEIKSEFERRNFIRDRLGVLPVFGGGLLGMIGFLRLLKFI